MKVSIIIPTYNYAAFLTETLHNLLAQSYSDWEAVIVDDGSTDNTKEIVTRFLENDTRFKYFFQRNAGLSNARNTGLKHASGQLIQFLDADDLLSIDKIEIQVKYLKNNPTVDLVYSDCFYFSNIQPEITFPDLALKGIEWMPQVTGEGYTVLRELISKNFTVVSSPLIRRTPSIQTIKFPEQVLNSEDWYYWLELALSGTHFYYLFDKKAFTLIRVHQKSMSQNTRKMYYGELQLRKWLISRLEKTQIERSLKNKLYTINQQINKDLLKHVMLTGPLWNLGHLFVMTQFASVLEVLKLHKLARKHQYK